MKWPDKIAWVFRPRAGLRSRPRPGIRRRGVMEYCANRELHPACAGLGVLSGRVLLPVYPGLKAWAILLCHFMAAVGRERSATFLGVETSEPASEMTPRVTG
jgi:hypothetical protein